MAFILEIAGKNGVLCLIYTFYIYRELECELASLQEQLVRDKTADHLLFRVEQEQLGIGIGITADHQLFGVEQEQLARAFAAEQQLFGVGPEQTRPAVASQVCTFVHLNSLYNFYSSFLCRCAQLWSNQNNGLLKGQSWEIFSLNFFHQTVPLFPLINSLDRF